MLVALRTDAVQSGGGATKIRLRPACSAWPLPPLQSLIGLPSNGAGTLLSQPFPLVASQGALPAWTILGCQERLSSRASPRGIQGALGRHARGRSLRPEPYSSPRLAGQRRLRNIPQILKCTLTLRTLEHPKRHCERRTAEVEPSWRTVPKMRPTLWIHLRRSLVMRHQSLRLLHSHHRHQPLRIARTRASRNALRLCAFCTARDRDHNANVKQV